MKDPEAGQREAQRANASLRQLPSVDRLLNNMPQLVARWGRERVTGAARLELDALRAGIQNGQQVANADSLLYEAISVRLEKDAAPTMRPVINLTGTVLHTNLGRAVLPEVALQAVLRCAATPVNLEYDLSEGNRGDRDDHVESLLCELTGAEAATVVNNNAAAVVLTLNALATNAEVPVSRGELVEIGGSFRIPEIMKSSGARLIEVGTTNRTHLRDYERAMGPSTALLMKVHTSNYRIDGFTSSVDEKALADLAHSRGLPLVIDLGSGCLVDFARYGLPAEPTVSTSIANGADLVTFSGDKLLGGPQCGVVAGKRDLLARIRRNPLKRALRVDKMTLSALAEVLKLYREPDTLAEHLPTLRMLTRPASDMEAQAQRLAPVLSQALGESHQVRVEPCRSQIGSGALPVENIASFALAIRCADGTDHSLRRLASAFRSLQRPVIGRLHDGALLLDLRCLDCEAEFIDQLTQLRNELR